jgi:hypothetical protein
MSEAKWPKAPDTSFFHGTEAHLEPIFKSCAKADASSLCTGLMTLHLRLSEKWRDCTAKNTKAGQSSSNWRWKADPFDYDQDERKKAGTKKDFEVQFERETAIQLNKWSSNKWANQVPVASGFIASRNDHKTALDFAHYNAEAKEITMFELKWASNDPLYAAFELVRYAFMLLIARREHPDKIKTAGEQWRQAERVKLAVAAPLGLFYEKHFPTGKRASLITFQKNLSTALEESRIFDTLSFGGFAFRWFPDWKTGTNWESEEELSCYLLDTKGQLSSAPEHAELLLHASTRATRAG